MANTEVLLDFKKVVSEDYLAYMQYVIRCQHLVANQLCGRLNDPLNIVISVDNHNKSNFPQEYLFHEYCSQYKEEFECLVMLTERWWLWVNNCLYCFILLWNMFV